MCENGQRTQFIASDEENRISFICDESQTVMTEPGPKVSGTIFQREFIGFEEGSEQRENNVNAVYHPHIVADGC